MHAKVSLIRLATETTTERVRPRHLSPAGAVARMEVVEAKRRGERIISEAQSQAHQIVESATAVRARIFGEARHEGLLQAGAELIFEWDKAKTRQTTITERSVCRSMRIASLMARRLLGEQLALDPNTIVLLANEVLRSIRCATHVVLHANPADAAMLRDRFDQLGTDEQTLRVKDDASKPRGSLKVTSNLGDLDADLRLELDRLAESLQRALKRATPPSGFEIGGAPVLRIQDVE